MGGTKKSEKGQSFIIATKSLKKNTRRKFLTYISILSLVTGCSVFPKKNSSPIIDNPFGEGSQQITFTGDNEHPRFSPDANRLLYSSSRNSFRQGRQLFEFDLIQKKERRITFSDGDAFDGSYIGENEVIYSSTTDEIKENIVMNGPSAASTKFPASEIYISDLFGTEIIRLTNQSGFDGEAQFLNHPVKPFVIFTSDRKTPTGIYRLDLENLPVNLVAFDKNKEKRFPLLSEDRKTMYWLEKDLTTEEHSFIKYNLKDKSMTVLKKDMNQYKDLFLAPRNPARIVYSVLAKEKKDWELEVFNLETGCTQSLLRGHGSLSSPAVSNDSKERIAFARTIVGQRQIYIMPMPTDLGPCIESSSQDILKK